MSSREDADDRAPVETQSSPPSDHARDESPEVQARDPRRYRILGEHGRGGIGRVSRAYDRDLDRDVAIKELTGLDFVPDSPDFLTTGADGRLVRWTTPDGAPATAVTLAKIDQPIDTFAIAPTTHAAVFAARESSMKPATRRARSTSKAAWSASTSAPLASVSPANELP